MEYNLGDPESYPEMREAAIKALDLLARVSLARTYPGMMTSGATESNILAAFYWRGRGKRRIQYTPGAHYSVVKAARLLGMKAEVIVDPGQVKEDALVVVTIGKTEDGSTDSVVELVEAAAKAGAAVHVDAAYAGPLAPSLTGLRLELDEVVATVAIDFHKVPEAPPPAGALYAFSEDVIDALNFEAHYIPSGKQPGLLGTRPGCIAFAALEAVRLTLLSWPGGPGGLAGDLDAMIRDISRRAEEAGYIVEGGPYPVRCLAHPGAPDLVSRLNRLGVKAYKCRGGGVRLVAMPHHLWEGYEWMIEALYEAVGYGRQGRG